MPVPIENIAPRRVTEIEGKAMDSNFFDALLGYKSAMAQAKSLYTKGLINADEYAIIETKMCERYGINFGSLYRENDWIYTLLYGNISPNKEVI